MLHFEILCPGYYFLWCVFMFPYISYWNCGTHRIFIMNTGITFAIELGPVVVGGGGRVTSKVWSRQIA